MQRTWTRTMLRPWRNSHARMQKLTSWLSAVASAAPAMPMSKAKMNSGSSATFRRPPAQMPYMESIASPSERSVLFSTNDAHMTGAASRMMRA